MIADLLSLTGRTAVITGAGSGIGRAIALLMGEAGARVVLAGRRADALADTAERMGRIGAPCRTAPTDVRDEKSVEALVETAIAEFDRIDIVVNCAGGAPLVSIEETTLARWDNIFALNVRGPFLLTQAAGQRMIESGGGVFINFSSIAGITGIHRGSAYASAKSSVQMLTRVVAAEWGRHRIRANCIAPGFIPSEGALRSSQRYGTRVLDDLKRATPLRELGSPEDVANLALFLASDASKHISGQTIAIDGGPVMPGADTDDVESSALS